MPFRSELDNVYFTIQTIGENLNCDVTRVDELQTTDKITDDMLRLITDADLIVGDLTYNNPNVFYEVGYAFALDKEILLIAKDVEDLPFDIKDYRTLAYNDETNARKLISTLRDPIRKALQRSINRANLTKPLLDMVKTSRKIQPSDDLFNKLLEIRLDETIKNLRSWTSGKMNTGTKETIIKGIQLFHNLKSGGFATYLAPISGYWTMNKEYLEEGRKTAKKRKKSIERVYILPTYSSLFSRDLQNLISEDEKWDITTYVAFSEDIPKDAIRDFGIWDNEVLCLIDTIKTHEEKTEVRGCLFSSDPSELSTARYWKDEILKVSYRGNEIVGELLKMDKDRYLLLNSANIMEDYAKMYCKGSYVNPTNCLWYHSSWQYLRMLDLVSTPFWHNKFYIKHIEQEITKRKVQKILVSGTADYAMLQHVHRALKKPDAEIVVLDLCRTALEICKWYSDQYMPSFPINFIQQDMFNTDFKDGTFDIVVTDAFLTRFTEVNRKKIVDELERILKPNSILITTIRLNGKDDIPIKGTKEDINCYVQKAERKLHQSGVLLIPIKEKIIEKAKIYAENIVSYPFRNIKEIEKLFSNFDVIIDISKTQGEMIEQTKYARVIARKK